MTPQEVLSINVGNLVKQQHDVVKTHVLTALARIYNMVENGDYAGVEKYCGWSPAGDGYGCDNHYIEFGISGADQRLEKMDIMEVCELLSKLRELSKLSPAELAKQAAEEESNVTGV